MITSPALTSNDVADHYDELDAYYRRLWGDHLHHGLWIDGSETVDVAVEQLIDAVTDPLNLKRGDRVCDIGCGYGGTSRYLVDRKTLEVTGMTISAAQYEYATAKTPHSSNPRFLLQNWEINELDAQSFDGVVSIECVSHVENKDVFFAQIHRVLKPGSSASITAWLTSETPTRWQQRHLLQPICDEGRMPAMASANEYNELIAAAGLRLVNFEDLSKRVRRTWRVCSRRMIGELVKSAEARRFLRQANHSIFALTVMRILAAYQTGAMRYGHFVFEKPADVKSL